MMSLATDRVSHTNGSRFSDNMSLEGGSRCDSPRFHLAMVASGFESSDFRVCLVAAGYWLQASKVSPEPVCGPIEQAETAQDVLDGC
jgi:hypothetical protein